MSMSSLINTYYKCDCFSKTVGGHVTEAAVRPTFGEATQAKRKLHRRIKPAQFFNFEHY